MEFQDMKYFYAVAKEGSFLGASKKLNYAQSNLSTRIRSLEEELGTPLFIRSRAGVTLTERGRVLMDYAERILPLAEEAESTVKYGHPKRTSLRVASLESAAATYLPGVLSKLHALHPTMRLAVQTGHTAANIRSLRAHEVDCAIVGGTITDEGLACVEICQEPLVLLMDAHTPADTPMETILRQPLIVFPQGCTYRRQLEALAAFYGIIPEMIFEMSSLGAILASISAGLGIGLLPEKAAKPYAKKKALRTHVLPPAFRTLPTSLVYYKKESDSTMQDLINALKQETAKKEK